MANQAMHATVLVLVLIIQTVEAAQHDVIAGSVASVKVTLHAA
jgi:hypothetical protein